ncbi:sulfite exporter TauE/SafE family protein [Alloscardovia criceti]|uniref:sulfite exporter TauE/SafE family protein n=1 Tax=Alloscardovia criceti TaxID=356828 RepID=UPI00037882C2|nr:sulfite exporter TauE/SafE family protein [Alloscardovia criceti]
MTYSLLIALCIGLLVGMVVGALGAGGGILSVPVLVYLLGLEPHAAAAGSLVIVGLTALISLIPRSQEGHVRWKDGFIFGLLSFVGTYVGSKLSGILPGSVLMTLFSLLLIVVGITMIRKAQKERKRELRLATLSGTQETVVIEETSGSSDTHAQSSSKSHNLIKLIACATATGFLTGFFGVGGGFAVVPMLVLAMSFTMKEASSTSLLVMLMASAVGLISRLGSDISVDWTIVISFAIASMLGGLIGAPLSRRFKDSTLTTAFGYLLLFVALANGISLI